MKKGDNIIVTWVTGVYELNVGDIGKVSRIVNDIYEQGFYVIFDKIEYNNEMFFNIDHEGNMINHNCIYCSNIHPYKKCKLINFKKVLRQSKLERILK